MPFDNGTVDILIRAAVSGQSEINDLKGGVERLSGAEKAHLDIMQKLDATMKTVASSVGGLTKAIEEGGAGVRKQTQSLDEWEKRLNSIVSNPAYSVNSPFSMLGRAAQQAAISMGTMGTAALGVTVGIATLAAGAIGLVNEMGQASRELLNFSLRLGLSVGQAQELQFAARLTGVEISTLEQSARLLGNALADGEGSGRKQVAALRELGVSAHEANGEEREMGAVLTDVLQKMGRLTDAAERAHLGQVLLGRSSKELIPLIAQYDEATSKAEMFASQLNSNVNATLAKSAEAMSELGIEWDILKKNLAAELAPITITIIRGITTVMEGEVNKGIPANPNLATRQLLSHGNMTKEQLADMDRKGYMDDLMSAAQSNGIMKAFDSKQSGTKPGYEAAIKAAKEAQEKQAGIIHDAGTTPDAKTKAVTEFNKQQHNIDNAEAGIKSIHDVTAAAERLKTLITEWTKKRDESNANALVNPEDKSKLAKIDQDRVNNLAENPFKNSKQLVGLINETGNTTWATEYTKEFVELNKELAKANSEWRKLNLESKKNEGKDFNKTELEPFESAKKEESRRLISDFSGVNRERRSNDIANYNIDSQQRLKLAGVSGSPTDQMSAFYGAQDASKSQAGETFKDSMASAKDLTDRLRASDLFARETKSIEYETELKIADLKERERQEDRKALGDLFDALTSGKSGAIGQLLKNEMKGVEKTVFTNALEAPLKAVRSSVSDYLTPKELNSDGKPNVVGKLLQGTPFGINAASPEIRSREENTTAIKTLTSALNNKNVTGSGAGVGSGGVITPAMLDPIWGGLGAATGTIGGVGSAARGAGGFVGAIENIFKPSPSAAKVGAVTTSVASGYTSDGVQKYAPEYYDNSGVYVAPSTGIPKNGSAGAKVAGAATAAIGGGIAIYEGIKKGGAQGTEEAIAGGLAALSVIPGPQQPFVAAAAAAMSLVSMITGVSAERRQKEMQNNVSGSFDRLAQAKSEQFDISGSMSDMTGPGTARQVGGVTVNLTAFDAHSILDHWEPIANALAHAVNQNHGVVDAIRQAR